MKYIPTIGLEIHAELRTKSKMFCSCRNDPDQATPNKNICPICLAHPGTLPVLNFEAIKNVLKIGLALNGTIADFTEWDRKNYFYPDIPKGYQISQYKYPLISGGKLAGVDIERIHLEEDTARSTHDKHEKSLVDFNRSGLPLMELVTKPVIHDAKTAVLFAKELQLLLRYLGAGEANMEKGEMRVEANVSVASPTDTEAGKFGTKTEVKNLNSFKSVEKAITHEIERQSTLLENGEKIKQETRGWDDNAGETYSQRSKESSHDYRYYPDPDIPKLKLSEISKLTIEDLARDLPELPWTKRDRYKKDYAMSEKEVAVFIEEPRVAAYFEKVIANYGSNPGKTKLTINYLLSDYIGLLKKTDSDYVKNLDAIKPGSFAELVSMVASGELSSRGAKDLIVMLVDKPDSSAKQLAKENNLLQKSNADDIFPVVEEVITANAKVVNEYKAGKTASLQFLMGQVMKATGGSANPSVVKDILEKKLKN